MAFETREGQGGLFKNDRKEKPSHPDYQGELRIGGVLYRVSAWVRESQKSGRKWMSLDIKPDQRDTEKPSATAPANGGQQTARRVEEFDDDIPF